MCRLRPPEPFTHCTRATNGGAGDDPVPVAEAGPPVEGPAVEGGVGGGVVVVDVPDDVADDPAGAEPAGAEEQPPRTVTATHTGTASAAPAKRDLQAAVMPPSSPARGLGWRTDTLVLSHAGETPFRQPALDGRVVHVCPNGRSAQARPTKV